MLQVMKLQGCCVRFKRINPLKYLRPKVEEVLLVGIFRQPDHRNFHCFLLKFLLRIKNTV